jgi:hypothetical protein
LKRAAARSTFISGIGIVRELDDNGMAAVVTRGRQQFRPLKPSEPSITFACPSCGARPSLATTRLVEILIKAIENGAPAVGINPSGSIRPLAHMVR